MQNWTSRGNSNSGVDAQQMMSKRRDQLNAELMRILEQETAAEQHREQQLQLAKDEKERKRLEKIFGLERA